MSRELVPYLKSEDLEWLGPHLELAGVDVKVGEIPPPPRERESWAQRTEREFREFAIGVLERQSAKCMAQAGEIRQTLPREDVPF